MPKTQVVFYQDSAGRVPVLQWLDTLPQAVQDKLMVRIERLAEWGHELRRPEADFLRDGLYELRIRRQQVNYRIIYFFHGRSAAILAHGLVKEAEISMKAIKQALERKRRFEDNPRRHTYQEKDCG